MDLVNKTLAYTITGSGPVITGDPASQLEKIISTIGALTIIAFIFFAFQIIFAGYSFLSSQGDAAKLKAARERLTQGILGIVIVVIAYGITAFLGKLLGLEYVFNLGEFINSVSP
jgi:hypothetical protein